MELLAHEAGRPWSISARILDPLHRFFCGKPMWRETAQSDASNEGAAATSLMSRMSCGIFHWSTHTSFQSNRHSSAFSSVCRVLQHRLILFLFFWGRSTIWWIMYVDFGNPGCKSLYFCLQTLYLLKKNVGMVVCVHVILKVSRRGKVNIRRDVRQSWRHKHSRFSERLFSHSNYL